MKKDDFRQRVFLRRWLPLATLAFFFVACAGRVIPDWTITGYNRLEDFKKAYLEGDLRIANLHFLKAVEEIKKSGDPDILAKAYLIRMGVESAALDEIKAEGFLKADAVESNVENLSYYHLMTGRLEAVRVDALPPTYRELYRALGREGDRAGVGKAVGAIEDPISRLIACGIAVRAERADEEVLKIAVDTASQQGWKKALTAYMERLRDYYATRGMDERAVGIGKRLDLIR